MRDEVEKLIVDWLKSDNENATYLAHQICVLLGVSVRYFKCSKCGHKIQTTNNDSGFLCTQPTPVRTSGICGGSYNVEISEEEYLKKEIS